MAAMEAELGQRAWLDALAAHGVNVSPKALEASRRSLAQLPETSDETHTRTLAMLDEISR